MLDYVQTAKKIKKKLIRKQSYNLKQRPFILEGKSLECIQLFLFYLFGCQ